MRAIIFLILVVLVFLVVRFILNRMSEIREKRFQADLEAEGEGNRDSEQTSEVMVQCAFCGVHLPQSEAIKEGENTFCSQDHKKAFEKSPAD